MSVTHCREVPSHFCTLCGWFQPSLAAAAQRFLVLCRQLLPRPDGSWHCVRGRSQLMAARAADMQNTPRYFRLAIEYINTDGLDMQNTPRYSLFQTGNRIVMATKRIHIYMQNTPRYSLFQTGNRILTCACTYMHIYARYAKILGYYGRQRHAKYSKTETNLWKVNTGCFFNWYPP